MGEIADSSALQIAVERHWQPGTELAVATLRWDSAGVLAEPRVLSTDLSPAALASMTGALTEAVRERSVAGSAAYLVLGEGGVPGVRRVARLGMCAPLFLNREEMTRAVQAAVRGMSVPRMERIRLLVKVMPDGSAGEIRIDEGTGDAGMDMAAARVFRGAHFDPARIQGIPVEVWAAFPVTLRPAHVPSSRR